VEKVVRVRTVEGKKEFKVRWKNFSSQADTWEPEQGLKDAWDLVVAFMARKEAQSKKKTAKKKKTAAIDARAKPKAKSKPKSAAPSVSESESESTSKSKSKSESEPGPAPSERAIAFLNSLPIPDGEEGDDEGGDEPKAPQAGPRKSPTPKSAKRRNMGRISRKATRALAQEAGKRSAKILELRNRRMEAERRRLDDRE
jgi:hypothetical protein